MADDSPDPSFRRAAAAYQSAGNLRRPAATPQIVRVVEPPAALPAPGSAANSTPAPAAVPPHGSSPESALTARPSGGVSLMITNAQKEDLRRLGLSEAEIRGMTPTEAHRRLGLSAR